MAESTIEEEGAEEEEAAEDAAAESPEAEDDGADATETEGDPEGADGEAAPADGASDGGEGEEGEEEEEAVPKVPLRERIDTFLHNAFIDEEHPAFLVQSNFITMVILYSIASILVEYVEELYADYGRFFRFTEVIVVAIFLIEYALTAYATKPTKSYVLGKWGIIDILAVIPSIISWISLPQFKVVQFTRILRILRFLRLMRLLKLAKGARTDYKKLAGVTLLGAGVPFLAAGIMLSLPTQIKTIVGCAGFVMIGVGDLIYLGSLHLKPLSPEEQARRNRQMFLSRVARARGIPQDKPESD